jgi:hypothetical protein
MKCKEAEQQRPDYKEALEADRAAIQAGNFNFDGIDMEGR